MTCFKSENHAKLYSMEWRAIGFLLLFMTTSALAEDTPQTPVKKQKIPIFPHVWFSEELLCTKAHEDGLAAANHAKPLSDHANYTKGSAVHPHFSWNFGLKIEVGYQPKKIYYFANWSYLPSTAELTKTTNGNTGFFPTLSLSKTVQPSSYVTSSDFHWKLNTNILDVGVSFNWQPVSYFCLRNHLGYNFTFLYQKFHVDYGGGIFNQGIDILRMHNNFFGTGPIVGTSPHFFLGKGLSLLGNFSVLPLLGFFHTEQKEKYLQNTLFHSSDHLIRLSWALRAKAALSWQKEFLFKALVFGVETGWEWYIYFNQNQLHQNRHFESSKNLFLQGGFVSFCLAF